MMCYYLNVQFQGQSIKYYIFWIVSVALVNQHKMCGGRIILSSVACSPIPYFSTLSPKRHDFRKKDFEHRMCFDFLYEFRLRCFSFSTEIWSNMYVGLHVKCPFFLFNLTETWIFSTDYREYSNIKFRENLSSGSRVVSCGRTDMTKLIVAFRNFANAPIKECISANI